MRHVQPGTRVRIRRSVEWGGDTVYGTVDRVTPSYVSATLPWRVHVRLDGVGPAINFSEDCVEEVSPIEELAATLAPVRKNPWYPKVGDRVREKGTTHFGTVESGIQPWGSSLCRVQWDAGEMSLIGFTKLEPVSPIEELAAVGTTSKKNPGIPRQTRVRVRVRRGPENRATTAYGTVTSEAFGYPRHWHRVDFDNGQWQMCRVEDLEVLSPLEELALLGKENPKPRKTPQMILDLLHNLGLEVGDYHRDVHWVTQGRKAYRLRLEGWGEECVPGKGRRAAEKAAAQLAETWRGEGWTEAGWLKAQDRDVWAITWALRGPFPLKAIRDDDFDPEEVIRL